MQKNTNQIYNKQPQSVGKAALLNAAAMLIPELMYGGDNLVGSGLTGAAYGAAQANNYNKGYGNFVNQKRALMESPNIAPFMANIINSVVSPEQLYKVQDQLFRMIPEGTPGQKEEIHDYQPHINRTNLLNVQPEYPQKPVPNNSMVRNGIADLSNRQPLTGQVGSSIANANNMYMTKAQKMGFEQSPVFNPSARSQQANAVYQEQENLRAPEIIESEISNRNARTDYLNVGNKAILSQMATQKENLTKRLNYLTNPKNRRSVKAQGYNDNSLDYEVKNLQKQIQNLNQQIYQNMIPAAQPGGIEELSPTAQNLINKYRKND
ncbi:MAG: hypothetical protein U9P90_02300 [Patescibacteria group bacterium]|nr:hypothetical protein [Patescibacteria group bacterium]